MASSVIFLSTSNKTAKTPRHISLLNGVEGAHDGGIPGGLLGIEVRTLFWTGDREASIPKTPTKRDNTPIILLVLAGMAALSTLAGYFFKPTQSGVVISTYPTTQSPAIGDMKTP